MQSLCEKEDHIGHRKRLRQRFESSGSFSGLHDHESLELLLTLLIPRKDVKPIAKELLRLFGNLKGVLDAPRDNLCAVDGIGESVAFNLSLIKETITAYLGQEACNRITLDSCSSLKSFWSARLSGLKDEVFEVGYLDSQYALLPGGIDRISTGTVGRTAVYPRKILEGALKLGASAIVLAHNHPAAPAQPSEQDLRVTDAVIHAASGLDVEVIDHLIVAREGIFSFREAKLLT